MGMRVGHRIAAVLLAALLGVTLAGCAQPPPDPLPSLPPYRTDMFTPPPTSAAPSTTPAATATPSQTPPASPSSVQPTYPIGSATPIPGFPTSTALATVNAHVAAGSWGLMQIPSTNSTEPTTVGVKINGLWRGQPGSLANQSYPNTAGVDMTKATPYFLSWSYVVTAGDALAVPAGTPMPQGGALFQVTSPISNRECPDYAPSVYRGIGVAVLRCTVVVSDDGGTISGVAFPVPGQTSQYWFFDVPATADKPS